MESAHKQILFTGCNASEKQTSECREQLSFLMHHIERINIVRVHFPW